MQTQSCLATFSAHNDFVKSIVLLPSAILGHIMGASSSAAGQPSASSAKLITSSSDKTICLWNTASGQPEKTLKGHARGVECLDVIFSDPTKDTVTATLVSGGSEGFIRGWDLQHVLNSDRSILDAEEDRIQIQNGHDTSVYGLAVVEGAVWSGTSLKRSSGMSTESFSQFLPTNRPENGIPKTALKRKCGSNILIS